MRLFRSKLGKVLAVYMAISLIFDVTFPTISYALTGGPSQPEVQAFAPIGTSDMVDVFSGSFSYNIPLLDVGGYPINIAYSAGSGMDEEASWVGLGWNINPGVIGRSVRGIPDDFKQDKIEHKFNIKGNTTVGLTAEKGIEFIGLETKKIIDSKNNLIKSDTSKFVKSRIKLSLGVLWNNYDGIGFNWGVSAAFNGARGSKLPYNTSLGLSSSSNSGVSLSPSFSLSYKAKEEEKKDNTYTTRIGLSMNSRAGLNDLTLGLEKSKKMASQTKKNQYIKRADRKNESNTANGNGSYSFANQTYVPSFDKAMVNVGAVFDVSLGAEGTGVYVKKGLKANYNGSYLVNNLRTTSAYGYLYSHEGNSDALHDFNRENDIPFTANTPNLPLSNYTYDIYSVSGQGVGGSFRPHRNDIGVLSDPKVVSYGKNAPKEGESQNSGMGLSVSAGADFGLGNAAKLGVNVSITSSTNSVGVWDKNSRNELIDYINFKKPSNGSSSEVVYFKQGGEKSVDKNFATYTNIKGEEAIRANITNSFFGGYLLKEFVDEKGTSFKISEKDVFKQQRNNRNQVMAIKTVDDANFSAIIKQIENYKFNDHKINEKGQYSEFENILRNAHPSHHISEIVIYRPDGVQYVYGIPAYNHKEVQQTFAVSSTGDCSTGLVSYTPTEASIDNKSGSDYYFDEKTTPKYAHSFLLTLILSPDYVDITGDGPTDDDLGTYTKINYTKALSNYKWRTPFDENRASFNEGLKSKPASANKISDDKGSVIYGEKEIWYVHSIVTKNYVAEFKLSKRKDAHSVKNQYGGADKDVALYKLDKISLYSKAERLLERNNPNYITKPLKEVHFVYDYSLCKDIPNNIKDTILTDNELSNAGGKLTLKSVYFTYEGSYKAKLNSYKFNYSSFNPNYGIKNTDRWGHYKPSEYSDCDDPNSLFTNGEFPYVNQNKQNQDKYASAWCLEEVKLPSGGKIKVEYESNDYAYVQDKRAMQMFLIKGMGNSTTPSFSKGLHNEIKTIGTDYLYGKDPNLYMYFKLMEPIEASTKDINNFLKQRYLENLDGINAEHLYFKFLVNIDNKDKFEYVSGYLKPDGIGCLSDIDTTINNVKYYTHGYIKIKPVGLSEEEVSTNGSDNNPISKTAWQFTRLYLPKVAYDLPDREDNAFMQIVESIASSFTQVYQYVVGFNYSLKQKKFANKFYRDKSFIRLNNPNYAKLGGGTRVKKIMMSDEWSSLTQVGNLKDYQYGQEYSYTKIENVGGKDIVISSGVAQYEPGIGGEENPFKQPIFYDETRLLAPNDLNYIEGPLGESFFPGASVGYSQVIVRDLQHENVNKSGTGKIVHKFYTAKDFPTKLKSTVATPTKHTGRKILNQLTSIDRLAVSQGYSIVLNDMHGKEKSTEVYSQGIVQKNSNGEFVETKEGELISAKRMKYKFKEVLGANNKKSLELDNEALVAYRTSVDGKNIKKETIGVEYDMVSDMRKSYSLSITGGVKYDTDGFVLLIPLVIPTFWPIFSKEETMFKSVVITKCVNKYALLDEIEAYDLGSTVKTKNLLYDAESGEVILTETINNFSDPIYSFTYPAHWVYPSMGMAYQNIGYTLNNKSLGSLNPDITKNFNIGDQLLLKSDNLNKLVWVTQVAANTISVVDREGNNNFSGDIKKIVVVRSGKKNMHSVAVGSITTLKNPMINIDGDANSEPDRLSFEKVLDAGSIEFTDKWKVSCNCGLNGVEGLSSMESEKYKFLIGAAGNWRPLRSWVYLSDRQKNVKNNNTSIRTDGVYERFSPFWTPPTTANGYWTIKTGLDNNTEGKDWQYTTKVSYFNLHGLELENQDALNRRTSALYGYYFSLPVAVANNSEIREVAFDSFEDYLPADCADDHFSYRKFKEKITDKESHTGRRSIQLGAGQYINVRKVINPCNDGNNNIQH